MNNHTNNNNKNHKNNDNSGSVVLVLQRAGHVLGDDFPIRRPGVHVRVDQRHAAHALGAFGLIIMMIENTNNNNNNNDNNTHWFNKKKKIIDS